MPIYQAENGRHHFFFDPSCDGSGSPPAWIMDIEGPDVTLRKDLDGDQICNVGAAIVVQSVSPVPPDGQWWVYCRDSNDREALSFSQEIVQFQVLALPTCARGPNPTPCACGMASCRADEACDAHTSTCTPASDSLPSCPTTTDTTHTGTSGTRTLSSVTATAVSTSASSVSSLSATDTASSTTPFTTTAISSTLTAISTTRTSMTSSTVTETTVTSATRTTVTTITVTSVTATATSITSVTSTRTVTATTTSTTNSATTTTGVTETSTVTTRSTLTQTTRTSTGTTITHTRSTGTLTTTLTGTATTATTGTTTKTDTSGTRTLTTATTDTATTASDTATTASDTATTPSTASITSTRSSTTTGTSTTPSTTTITSTRSSTTTGTSTISSTTTGTSTASSTTTGTWTSDTNTTGTQTTATTGSQTTASTTTDTWTSTETTRSATTTTGTSSRTTTSSSGTTATLTSTSQSSSTSVTGTLTSTSSVSLTSSTESSTTSSTLSTATATAAFSTFEFHGTGHWGGGQTARSARSTIATCEGCSQDCLDKEGCFAFALNADCGEPNATGLCRLYASLDQWTDDPFWQAFTVRRGAPTGSPTAAPTLAPTSAPSSSPTPTFNLETASSQSSGVQLEAGGSALVVALIATVAGCILLSTAGAFLVHTIKKRKLPKDADLAEEASNAKDVEFDGGMVMNPSVEKPPSEKGLSEKPTRKSEPAEPEDPEVDEAEDHDSGARSARSSAVPDEADAREPAPGTMVWVDLEAEEELQEEHVPEEVFSVGSADRAQWCPSSCCDGRTGAVGSELGPATAPVLCFASCCGADASGAVHGGYGEDRPSRAAPQERAAASSWGGFCLCQPDHPPSNRSMATSGYYQEEWGAEEEEELVVTVGTWADPQARGSAAAPVVQRAGRTLVSL